MSDNWIGARLSRKEDERLITGHGEFMADIKSRDTLYAAFVRSDVAHGRILSIDVDAARALPGVVAVLTGEDIRHEIRPLPTEATQSLLPAHYPRHWPLAVEKVNFQGEPIAVIVAENKYVAEDAAQLIDPTYETLEPVLDPEYALSDEAPIIHQEMGTNEIFGATLTGGATIEDQEENSRAVEALIANAPCVVSKRFRTHRCGVMPMETRGALMSWDKERGLRCWMTTQRPHIDRLVFADLFNLPQADVHVSAPPDQGGAFGVKAPVYREPLIIAYLAIKLGRPIRWIESREEHLAAVSQERDQIHDLTIASDLDGRIIALKAKIIADNGDGCEGVFWGFVMPFYGAAMLPNGYDIKACTISLRCATTNKSALSPARAFGTLPGRFALDRAIDMLAHKLGKEPADVRRLNIIRDLPYDTATGVHYDKGDFLKVWDKLMESVNLPAFRAEQTRGWATGKYKGIGLAISVHASGVASSALVPMEGQPGYGSATIKIDSSGSVLVFEGDAPQGQGHETTMSQIAASILGLSPTDVRVRTGDTETAPFSSGTFGARGGSYTASAVAKAAIELRYRMAIVAIHDAKIDAKPDELVFENGGIFWVEKQREIASFRGLASRIIMRPLDLPENFEPSLECTALFEAREPMVSFDAVAIVTEVDPKSGEFSIDRIVVAGDVGRAINPQIVEGQVHGGVVQGLSNAMFEEFLYDENGQQLSTTLEHYKLANAYGLPHIEVLHANTPCEHTPLGTRGMGEGTPGPIPGALCNAICDALRPMGIEITQLPIRPDRLWQLIRRQTAHAAT